MIKPIEVLIIDDSRLMCKILEDILNRIPNVRVTGIAHNGLEGLEKIKQLKPQVVTMDVEMPIMDGLRALEKIMEEKPLPVIVLSSITTEGAVPTLKAFDLGAFDVIAKPVSKFGSDLEVFSRHLKDSIRAASLAKSFLLGKKTSIHNRQHTILRNSIEPSVKQVKPVNGNLVKKLPVQLIVIGISTGGPPALHTLLPQLPADLTVPIVVIQHMPSGFTGPLAERLDSISALKISEGKQGDILRPGNVYIAPAGKQTEIKLTAGKLVLEIGNDSPIKTHYKPSVDVTLLSLAKEGIKGVVGVIMTGMGNDGLQGIKEIKSLGGFAITQSEDTCVVYGMPKVVKEAGLADRVEPLQNIARAIIETVRGGY